MMHSLITDSVVIYLSKEIKYKTIMLLRQYKLKLPDAIIADKEAISDKKLLLLLDEAGLL